MTDIPERLPPIPDEAYNAGRETIGSAYVWGTSDDVIDAAYPILAAHVLRWAAEQLQPPCDHVKVLRRMAGEVSRGD